MAVVSVRVDDDTLTILRAHQVNVSAVARAALAHEARRCRAIDGLSRLQDWAGAAGPETAATMIRRLRDER